MNGCSGVLRQNRWTESDINLTSLTTSQLTHTKINSFLRALPALNCK